MSQVSKGFANVTNGSALITSDTNADWSTVTTGSLFILNGALATYVIGATPTFSSGIWHATLTSNYAGATATNQNYVISTSFTPTLGIPYAEQGDTQSAAIFKRAMQILDVKVASSSMLANTRFSFGVINASASGDMFGFEQVSAAQSGDANALRIYTSALSSAYTAFGKYTSATAFTEYARFTSAGILKLNATTMLFNGMTLTAPASSGTIALTSQLSDASQLTTGTLASARLPTSGASAGTYGSTTQTPVITVDAFGRITSVSNATVTIGEVNVGASVGAGVSLYSGKVGTAIQIKSLTGTSGITVTDNGTSVNISAAATQALAANTRQSVAVINNAGTGDMFGLEQVSAAQTGSNNAIRLFTSALSSAYIGFGRYTTASTFDEFAQFTNSGIFTVERSTMVFNGQTLTAPASSGTIALTSQVGNASNLTTGTLSTSLFPASGATAGSYGSSTAIPVITVDALGRITSIAATTANGEANTVSNSGTGTGWFISKTGVNFAFKSVAAGTGISLADNGTTVTLSASFSTSEVSTIAALKALSVATYVTGNYVHVAGYYADGDGGGGLYYYESASAATANNGTVIQPTVGSGRWIREFAGIVPVKVFGAKGDGTTDDVTTLQAAHDAASAGSFDLDFGSSTYYISTAVNITGSYLYLFGNGASVISLSTGNGKKFNITGSNISIRGITFDGFQTGSTGTPTFAYGLIELNGDSATVSTIKIRDCTFRNSLCLGIYIRSSVTDILIEGNTFTHNFICIWGESVNHTTIFSNVRIVNNSFTNAWYTSTFSGAIKLKGDYSNSQFAYDVLVEDNTIISCGEMGVEYFDSIQRSRVIGNTITGCTFGVSTDHCDGAVIEGNNVQANSFCGIELADVTINTIVTGNSVNGYTQGTTTKFSSIGIVIENDNSCIKNFITNNNIIGVNGDGIRVQAGQYAYVEGNRVTDCITMVNSKKSNYVYIKNNTFVGPCSQHIFLDYNDASGNDVDIVGNTFMGAAANDNITIYDNLHGNTLTNLRICDNNAINATYGNLSINTAIPVSRLPNFQVYRNYFKIASTYANFADQCQDASKLPDFMPLAQKGGISTATRRTMTVPSSGSAQWVKVFDGSLGFPILLQMHILAINTSTTPVKSAINALIAAAPYGMNSSIELAPSSAYVGGVVAQIVYNNVTSVGDGSTQQVWVKFVASTTNITVDLCFSDYSTAALTSWSFTTTQPTWETNHYKTDAQLQNFLSHYRQGPGLLIQRGIACAGESVLSETAGRLYIRGVGVESFDSTQRVARFDKDDGTEAFGVDQNGKVLMPLALTVGGGGTVTRINSGTGSITFPTAGAGGESSWNLFVSGCTTNSGFPPTVMLGWGAGLPAGVVVKTAYVSSANNVTIVLYNANTSSQTFSAIQVTAVVFALS